MLNFELLEDTIVGGGPNKEEIKNRLKGKSLSELEQMKIRNKERVENLSLEFDVLGEIIEEKKEEIAYTLKN